MWYRWIAQNNGDKHFRIGMDCLSIDVYIVTAMNALSRIAISSFSPSSVNCTAVLVQFTKYTLPKTRRYRLSLGLVAPYIFAERRFLLLDSVDLV